MKYVPLCTNAMRREPIDMPPLPNLEQPTKNKGGRGIKKRVKKNTFDWIDHALQLAMAALDNGYKMEQVCKKYGIPRTSLKDHYSGKTKS